MPLMILEDEQARSEDSEEEERGSRLVPIPSSSSMCRSHDELGSNAKRRNAGQTRRLFSPHMYPAPLYVCQNSRMRWALRGQ